MRILVNHETTYRYEQAAKSVIQALRLTPRSHDGQYVVRWRIDVDRDVRLVEDEDAFGNLVHVFTATGPLDSLRVAVVGEVETDDRAGMLRGSVERFPPSLYLRETELSRADPALRAFAAKAAAGEATRLGTCHALMAAVHDAITFDTAATLPATTAVGAFAARRGVCQDLTHIFIAAARSLKIPARYVGGHLHRSDGVAHQKAGHAWAEAHVEGYGWIGFDPANNLCPTESHVRVATGLDGLGASPVRGARNGGDGESLDVLIEITTREPQHRADRAIGAGSRPDASSGLSRRVTPCTGTLHQEPGPATRRK